MRTVAILPVKTFGRAKQRLGRAFSDRPALAAAMVADVLETLTSLPALHEVIVVTAEPDAAELARRAGARVVNDPVEAGQSAAVLLGIAAAVADRVLLVPGDCPSLDAGELTALLAHTEPVVIVPDRHGQGTNALLLTPPDVMAPAFGEGSFARHAALAAAAGATLRVVDVPSLGLDIDTAEDLAALTRAPGIGPRTRALLDQAAVA
jgi:2-phospho-L-lactate/phosphoenolpyruvate guanylyltransferase